MIKTELKFWSCTGCISILSLPLARQVRFCKVHGSVLHLQDGSDGNCYYNFTFKCMCIYTCVHAQTYKCLWYLLLFPSGKAGEQPRAFACLFHISSTWYHMWPQITLLLRQNMQENQVPVANPQSLSLTPDLTASSKCHVCTFQWEKIHRKLLKN